MVELKKLHERATREVESFKLSLLQKVGLERTLDSYYLIGTYPPLAAMQEPSNDFVDTVLSALRQPVDLYVHFPFCRAMGAYECSFCHFYKELHDSTLEDKYVDACIKELKMYKRKLGGIKARSIYFGGGTFSLVSLKNLERLLSFIWGELDVESGAEVKFEIHADSAKTPGLLKSLLSLLKGFEVTHIVVDIQTLNEESLAAVSWGRVRPSDFFKTLETCVSSGFDRIVTGLILGLPFESFESFLRSVLLIAVIPQIVTINIFPLMFRKGDLVYDQLCHTPEIFPNVHQRDIMHQGTRILLDAFGFYESPIYFMNRHGTKADHQTSKFEGNSLLGIGASSFGMFRGHDIAQYYNTPNVHQYLEFIGQEIFPIWYVGPLSDLGWAIRCMLFGNLNLNQPFDMRELDPPLKNHFLPLVEFFTHLGLLELEGESVFLTQKGLLRAEEISYFFAEEPVRLALGSLTGHGDVSKYNYFITRSLEQEKLFYESCEIFGRKQKMAAQLHNISLLKDRGIPHKVI